MALALTALLSTAGGVVAHGIYFLTREAYRFEDDDSLRLAIATFLLYVPGALVAGRLGRAIGARSSLHLGNAVSLAAALVLAFTPPVWGLWAAVALYNGAAGLMWPLVEGYAARHPAGMHQAIGGFNLTWSLALAPALWLVAAIGHDLALTFGVLLAFHLALGAAIAALPAEPPPHEDAHGGPGAPDHYRELLRQSRVLLPIAYLLLYTLTPLLPGVWAGVGVEGTLGAALTSVWMIARFVLFYAFTRNGAWRGRRRTLVGGVAGLLGGFALVLSGGSVPAVLAGLALFGAGHAAVYFSALYYGMSVGKGDVESGGAHEAMIGVGYLGGPVLGIIGLASGIPPVQLVGALATVGMAAGLWPRAARPVTRPSRG